MLERWHLWALRKVKAAAVRSMTEITPLEVLLSEALTGDAEYVSLMAHAEGDRNGTEITEVHENRRIGQEALRSEEPKVPIEERTAPRRGF